jgi:hypothetical protein
VWHGTGGRLIRGNYGQKAKKAFCRAINQSKPSHTYLMSIDPKKDKNGCGTAGFSII